MRALALAVLATAVHVLLLSDDASGAELCSDTANKALYDDALARIASCKAQVNFELTPPLTASHTRTLCSTCTSLAAATKAKRFGDCTVAGANSGETTTLQAQLESLFVCSSATPPPSGSGSGSGDIEMPTPTTSAPTPSKTNATSSSGSETTLAPTPATKTPSPTVEEPLKESSSSRSSLSNSGGSKSSGGESKDLGSRNGQQIITIETTKGSSTSIGMVVGIAAGVVVLVILIATCVVCRQRRRSRRQSNGELLISSANVDSDGLRIGSSKQGGHSDGNSTTLSVPGTFSYLNETFLLPSHGGGLWDDEAIVAARIPREKVISEALLSRGGYGEVYRGSYNGQVVAIKTLLPETRKNMKQINAFLAEVKLMASLEHDQVVRFIGVAWDSLTDLCVVSEYMEGGDLRSVLTQFEEVEHRPHGFDHDKVKIALHISHALTYLHSLEQSVLHRDLKSKNILLDNELNAKLTDFGVSRERSDRTMTAGVGTSLWMAPEVMLGERYDEKSDIFSFGVVLSELDSHLVPYSQVTESSPGHRIPDTAILQMVSLGRLRVAFSPEADPAMVEIANACVSLNPQDRPSASDVLYQLHNVLKRY